MMRSFLTIATIATCASSSNAFVAPRPVVPTIIHHAATTTMLHSHHDNINNFHSIDTKMMDSPSSTSLSWRKRSIQRIKNTGEKVLERMDTMKAAGLYDQMTDKDGNELVPMQAGFKMNVGLLVAAFMFKWYRARFINKIPVWDRQPQWNMVITSPEQEKELSAYQCKNCGATIFIARHREWFFQGGNSECTNCGATGKDNFENIREDVVDSIDDDYFDYESPLDFVSAAERRKLIKEAGGDEELAKQIAIGKVMENDKEQVKKVEKDDNDNDDDDVVVGEDTTSSSSDDEEKKEEGEKKKKKKKKAPEPKKEDDIFDELDLD